MEPEGRHKDRRSYWNTAQSAEQAVGRDPPRAHRRSRRRRGAAAKGASLFEGRADPEARKSGARIGRHKDQRSFGYGAKRRVGRRPQPAQGPIGDQGDGKEPQQRRSLFKTGRLLGPKRVEPEGRHKARPPGLLEIRREASNRPKAVIPRRPSETKRRTPLRSAAFLPLASAPDRPGGPDQGEARSPPEAIGDQERA